MNLAHFLEFGKQKFHLLAMAQKCPDSRKKPEIPIATIFLLVVLGLAMRRRNFHQMDQWARMGGVKRLLGSRRFMVASDATLWRVLPGVNVETVREFVQQSYGRWKELTEGALTLSKGRRLRVGIVDGSMFGKFYASCLQIKADRGDYFLDLEVGAGKGKELPTSEALLARATARHGKGFVDLVMGDGLYITEKFLESSRGRGLHVLVKTTEEGSLNILQDARAIFDSRETSGLAEKKSGVDADRGVTYVVQAAGGFRHAEYSGTLKVARVTEEPVKPSLKRGREVFWVICTDETLTAVDLRELAHLRWSVENQGFKMLNEQMNSKHVWTRGAKSRQTFEVLMLLMFLTFALVKTFEAGLEEGYLWEALRLRKLTLEFMVRIWESTLEQAPPLLERTG